MRLRLNTNKMEYITFVSRTQLWKISTKPLTTCNDIIQMAPDVKCLRGTLDSELNFNKDITMKVRKAMSNFICIKAIQKYLTKQACTTLVLFLCILHLDKVNTLLYGLPKNPKRDYKQFKTYVPSLCCKAQSTPAQHKYSWTFTGSQLDNESTTRY